MTTLDTLRQRFGRFLIGLLWLHLPIVVLAAWIAGNPMLVPVSVAGGLAGLSTLMWRRSAIGPATRLVSSLSLIGMAAILLSAFAGHPWQVEKCQTAEKDNPVLGYPRGQQCNVRGLTSLGAYAVNGLIDRNMAIDIDHFKRVDDTTVMGIMNGKGGVIDGRHLYFYLERV